MLRMNRVMLVGNLTRDPVLRKTPAGVACVDMTLAANESYTGKDGKAQESVCFVDVVAWEKQAEACGEFLKKGVPVFVEDGLAVGIAMKGNRPLVVINLTASKAEGADFSSQLLHIAKIIP